MNILLAVFQAFVSFTLLNVYVLVQSNWMYLGLVGVPPPLQQQQVESGAEIEDPGLLKANAICSAITGLIPEQIEVCMKHPAILYPVASGAHKGIQECQYQFRHERWNCSTSENDEDVFGYVLKSGSKEAAFIYAVTTAGVVHAVTHGCSTGDLAECSCDTSNHGKNTPEGWKWGGCSDNVEYGIEFARKFVDASEQIKPFVKYDAKTKGRIQMNLHNNEVGRLMIMSLMRMHCRCHGVSGSCELKTCWKTIPPFTEVGDLLKRKYNKAILLRNAESAGKLRNKRNKGKIRKVITESDLIHISRSPNFCRHNPKKGILGTKDRKCDKTSQGADSCAVLCCGRGYYTRVVKIKEKCHCKFVWCCYVKCKICEKELYTYHCK